MDAEDARRRIAARRAAAVGSLTLVTRDVGRIVAAAQLTSADDEHDPEGATIAFERAQTLAVADQLRRGLADLDAAAARLDAGTYGICEVCARPIAEARLEARPTATRCIDCASG
jgi:DnaK suppressor protein